MQKKNKTGFAIALAWPELYCKQAGGWYDIPLNFLGITKNNYYKVGHAAIVLINGENLTAHYFDFGRYHAPYGYARARCAETDTELNLKTKPLVDVSRGEILNFTEFLVELQSSNVFHGEGTLYASYTCIQFEHAFAKAMEMVEKSPMKYGPFQYKGSNCSRFVCDVLNAGSLNLLEWLKLNFLIPLTPTTLTNVRALPHQTTMQKIHDTPTFIPVKLTKQQLKSTLTPPKLPKHLPSSAQWLAGEGVGSWFVIKHEQNTFYMERYSATGVLECSGKMIQSSGHNLDFSVPFQVLYKSNCRQIYLQQLDQIHIFKKVD